MKEILSLPALCILLGALAGTVVEAAGSPLEDDWRYTAFAEPQPAIPSIPGLGGAQVELVLDDGVAEGRFGVGTANARQFLWFNHFSPGLDLELEEIWVLFPGGGEVLVGDAIDLVVYRDPDGDPTNGATLLATVGETVRHADGTTFSIYELAPGIVTGGDDVYLGVIPRFIESGISPPTLPATLDQSASQMRSWVAVWSGDPPGDPHLPPDGQIHRIDDFVPGNWMIRGLGRPRGVTEVPALGGWGLGLLAVLLMAAGVLRLRRA